MVRERRAPLSAVPLEVGHELVRPEGGPKPLEGLISCPSTAPIVVAGGAVEQDAGCAEGGRKPIDWSDQ